MIGSFAWLELAYYDPSRPGPSACGSSRYSVAALAGARAVGRGRGCAYGEGFAALFGLLGAMAPFFRDAETGRLRGRWPFSGLAGGPAAAGPRRPGARRARLDHLRRRARRRSTRLEPGDIVGRPHAAGRRRSSTPSAWLFMIVVVALRAGPAPRGCRRASPATTPPRWATPTCRRSCRSCFAYAIAHYFSLFVFETYNVVAAGVGPVRPGLGPVRHDRRRARLHAAVDDDDRLGAGRRPSSSATSAASSPPTTAPSSATARPRSPAGRSGRWSGAMVAVHRRRPRPAARGIVAAVVVAHQGGWDEILFVLAPIALFAVLLFIANKRAGPAVDDEEDERVSWWLLQYDLVRRLPRAPAGAAGRAPRAGDGRPRARGAGAGRRPRRPRRRRRARVPGRRRYRRRAVRRGRPLRARGPRVVVARAGLDRRRRRGVSASRPARRRRRATRSLPTRSS